MDLKTVLRAQWDRATAIACTALGAILLLVGWIGVSGTPFLAEQAPYILSGGVGGVFLLGVGATLWISGDLRDEWRKLDRIESALQDGTLRFVDEDVDVPTQRYDDGSYEELEAPRLDLSTARMSNGHAPEPEVVAVPRKPRTARTSGSRSMNTEAVAGTPKRRRAGVGHA
ncbi:MAG: hypothetical protein JWM64_1165 [Frankiales bacterium]|nr:hypothetical protein [Frankiales bacterium]